MNHPSFRSGKHAVYRISTLLLMMLVISFSCDDDNRNETNEPPTILLRPSSYFGFIGTPITFGIINEFGYYYTSGVEVWVNHSKLDGNTFIPSHIGTYSVYAEQKGLKTQTIQISIREEKVFPSLSIPVVFHVREGFQFDFGKQIEAVNEIFNGLPGKDPLIVNTYISFRLAQYDLAGAPLAESGVIRYPEIIIDSTLRATVMKNFPPEKYLNVLVERQNIKGTGATGPANEQFPECNAAYFNLSVNDSVNTYQEFQEYVKERFGSNYSAGFIGCTIPENLLGSDFLDAHEFGHVLGLHHPFNNDCAGDITCLEDTRYYAVSGDKLGKSNYYCATGYIIFDHRSVMDYPGTSDGFTYDECILLRHVLEYRPMLRLLKFSDR